MQSLGEEGALEQLHFYEWSHKKEAGEGQEHAQLQSRERTGQAEKHRHMETRAAQEIKGYTVATK